MILRIAILAAAAVTSAAAQTSTFDLQSGGRSMGRNAYTLSKAKQGYKLSSRVSYHINGVQTDSSDEFKFADDYIYLEGISSNDSTQMRTSFVPNKARTDLTIGMTQGGAQDSHHLAVKPAFVLLPSFDAGAAQAMLLLATTHPTPDNLYNVVVPGAPAARGAQPAGDSGASGPQQPSGNNAYDALWSKRADAAGTLDGKPITLHTFVLTSGKFTWTFYADETNTLMELDNSMLRASYIRAKFKLDAPS